MRAFKIVWGKNTPREGTLSKLVVLEKAGNLPHQRRLVKTVKPCGKGRQFLVSSRQHFAHLSLPWSIGWVALSFLFVCSFVRPSRYGNIRPNLHFYFPHTPKPIHFLKAYDNSYSKMNKEHKYKDKDEYKDNDKDKDAERITESLTVCYIFGILTTQAFQVWWWIPPPGQPHHPCHPRHPVTPLPPPTPLTPKKFSPQKISLKLSDFPLSTWDEHSCTLV